MIQDLLTIFVLSTIPAAFGLLLDYALGFPGKEEGPNAKAIFFKIWSYRLAEWAVKRAEKYSEIRDRFSNFDRTPEMEELIEKTIFIEGKKLFHIEQAFGMCVFCTNVWLSLITATILYFHVDFLTINHKFLFLLIPIYSHCIIRKF
jgi:hypothetical protein